MRPLVIAVQFVKFAFRAVSRGVLDSLVGATPIPFRSSFMNLSSAVPLADEDNLCFFTHS